MNWNDHFFNLAFEVAKKSKDTSTKVGVIIVGPDNEIRSTGFNGFPRGVNERIGCRWDRPEKYHWVEHAERNAIYNAARMGTALKGCTMYQPGLPCSDCARAIVQAGITQVYSRGRKMPPKTAADKWDESNTFGQVILSEGGVRFTIIPGEEEFKASVPSGTGDPEGTYPGRDYN